MKTVKIKFTPTREFIEYFSRSTEELDWVWDRLLSFQLHNQCLKWYQWAKKKEKLSQQPKKSDDDFLPFTLDGIIECPLHFGKRSPYMYAACQIARGGPFWVKDTAIVIRYKNAKGENKRKFGSKLIDSGKPYEKLSIAPFEYRSIMGTQIKTVAALDSLSRLNTLRSQDGLPELSIHSDYVGGLIKDFETAWKAFEDVSLPDRSMPKFSRNKARKLQTLYNRQSGSVRVIGEQIQVANKIILNPCDRTWKDRIDGYALRSYRITRRPSGWYLCVSVGSDHEALRPTLKRKLDLRASEVKKQAGSDKALQIEALAQDSEYQTLRNALEELDERITQDLKQNFGAKDSANVSTLKPGITKILSAENDRAFNRNSARTRIENHIIVLQGKLDRMRDRNDKRIRARWRQSERPPSKNEQHLQHRISRLHEKAANSSNAFNHKLSTRLTRTYKTINWEEYNLKSMMRSPEAILAEDGSHFDKNKGEQKAFRNRLLKCASIGDLKQKTQAKMEIAGKEFIQFNTLPQKSTK